MQSAPSRDPIAPPRRVVKPPVRIEAQAQPAPKAARTTRSIQKSDPQPQQPAQQQQSNVRTGTGMPAAGERRFNQNEVVIEVAGRPTPAQVDAMARRHRLNREELQVFNLSGTTMFRWTIPDGRNVASVIRSLEADSSHPVGAAELSLHPAAGAGPATASNIRSRS